MKYIDYKRKIEFGKKEYNTIDKFCKKLVLFGLHLAGMNHQLNLLKNIK